MTAATTAAQLAALGFVGVIAAGIRWGSRRSLLRWAGVLGCSCFAGGAALMGSSGFFLLFLVGVPLCWGE